MIADLGNARRTASLLIYVGLAALLVVSLCVAMPERRRMLKKLNVVLVILGAALYLGAFWNSSGTLGQPARAVHSAIAPNARDLSSDQYRVVENANLIQGIHSTRSVGKGFGTPINYGFATIVNLTSIDSMIAYIPHNGVLYVWYRLGIAGEIALWSIVGFGILAGSRLAKHRAEHRDRETAVLGAIAVCAVLCWVLQGYNDLGFTWLRIAIFMGFMLGALQATSRRVGPPRDKNKAAVNRLHTSLVDTIGLDVTQSDVPEQYSGQCETQAWVTRSELAVPIGTAYVVPRTSDPTTVSPAPRRPWSGRHPGYPSVQRRSAGLQSQYVELAAPWAPTGVGRSRSRGRLHERVASL